MITNHTKLASFIYFLSVSITYSKIIHAISIESTDLIEFYKPRLQELDLSGAHIGDEQINNLCTKLISFIERNPVKRLILSNTGLTEIPFEIIGLGIISRHLNYISIKGNYFEFQKIPNLAEYIKKNKWILNQNPNYKLFFHFFLSDSQESAGYNKLEVEFSCKFEPTLINKNSNILTLFEKMPFNEALFIIGGIIITIEPKFINLWIETFPKYCPTLTTIQLKE